MAIKKAVSKSSASTVKKPTATAKSTTKTTTVKAVVTVKKSTLFTSPLAKKPIIAALIAELFGTFLLATAVVAGQGQPIIILFAIAGITLLFVAISGAHLNPAITVGAWVTRRITGLRALGYIAVQFIGAGVGFLLLNAFVGGAPQLSASAAAYGQTATTLFHANALPAGKEWYIFFSELIGTLVLGYALATAGRIRRDRVASALTVGFGIFVALLLAASAAAYVGGSAIINPAVALSLQALKWDLWPLAVYVLAPMIGGVIGFILYDVLKTTPEEE
jgi:aquaporin Z